MWDDGGMTKTFDLYAFIDELYEPDFDSGAFRCKRCGQIVDWVTKHAAVKHGDDVQVMPPLNKTVTQARW